MVNIQKILEQRTRLEEQLRELGVRQLPKPWAHDINGLLRNLQLLEQVEDIQRGRK
jgi:hypothetical protein